MKNKLNLNSFVNKDFSHQHCGLITSFVAIGSAATCPVVKPCPGGKLSCYHRHSLRALPHLCHFTQPDDVIVLDAAPLASALAV